MKHRGQSYIAAMLAIFVAFVALLVTLPSVVPLTKITDKVDTAILSVNETLKGCCAFASLENWKVLYSAKISGEGGATVSATDRFFNCWATSRDLIQGYYGLRVDGDPDFEHKGSALTCKAETSVSKLGTTSKFLWMKSLEIRIVGEETEIRGEFLNKYLEINFTLKGFKPPYVNVEVYFLDVQDSEVYLRKVLEGFFLPISIEEDVFKYRVRILLELKYLAKGGTLQYIVKASDETGACVWAEGSVDLEKE